jgi:hypothetical protein
VSLTKILKIGIMMKYQPVFIKTLLMMCFFVSLAGCSKDEHKEAANKTGHGHSHD